MYPSENRAIIESLVRGDLHDPFQLLGVHFSQNDQKTATVRTFQPYAKTVHLVFDKRYHEMNKIHGDGLFEISLSIDSHVDISLEPYFYQFSIQYHDGNISLINDPYRFLPQMEVTDSFLYNFGTNYSIYNHLGSHLTTLNDVSGVIFRVWAPAAKRVSVIGDFNGWDGRVHCMRSLGESGIWELFIPGLDEYLLYKYEVKSQSDTIQEKADPFQFFGEFRPSTASIIRNLDNYAWNDSDWQMQKENTSPYDAPLSIYEVHPGSWQRDPENPDRFLSFRELAEKLIPHVKQLGFTHIELMPVMEHPLDESWGYQVTGSFSLTSRYGKPEDFMYFVDKCHQNNIGVILDWVPAHFPKDSHSLSFFDGTALYEHQDPRKGEHPEWGTYIYNYGRKEVSNYLISNALFWFDKYHIDGLRVDAVSSMLYLDYARKAGEWEPNYFGGRENLEAIEFMRHLNSIVYEKFPGSLMIAEESTSFYGVSKPTDIGGLGFGYKWNMGWMNDTLAFFSKDPVYRKFHHNNLTFSLMYAFSENFILPLSHDEVVHGKCSLINKMPGDLWQKFANLRLLYSYLWCHPGKKLLFMGGEFGQFSEWYCKRSLDWHLLSENKLHSELMNCIKELNRVYKENEPLYELDHNNEGFKWLDFEDRKNSVISFARYSQEDGKHLVCIFNFTPQTLYNYQLGCLSSKKYFKIFDSDSKQFGGSGANEIETYDPSDIPFAHAPHHITLTVPPLAGIILQPQPVNKT